MAERSRNPEAIAEVEVTGGSKIYKKLQTRPSLPQLTYSLLPFFAQISQPFKRLAI